MPSPASAHFSANGVKCQPQSSPYLSPNPWTLSTHLQGCPLKTRLTPRLHQLQGCLLRNLQAARLRRLQGCHHRRHPPRHHSLLQGWLPLSSRITTFLPKETLHLRLRYPVGLARSRSQLKSSQILYPVVHVPAPTKRTQSNHWLPQADAFL